MSLANNEAPSIWTTGWTDVLNTGTWRSAIPVHQRRPSPCHGVCPVNGEIPSWIHLVKEERFDQAWLSLVANNPFPAVTGRICHHPCEKACNRGEYDGAVTINALEQFVGDLALRNGWSLPQPGREQNYEVAIIGGGPAGLSCAYRLRQLGFRVTIFDAKPELGGVLRYGIPRYRLPAEILDAEIKRILALGVDVRTNHWVGPEEIERLQKEYAAVFIALGAQRPKKLPQFPDDDSRILDGLQFLFRVNQADHPSLGSEVAVIGGGSVAVDVARVARRLGSKVKVIALEDREHLPAHADEVKEASEEGVAFVDGALVEHVVNTGSRLSLECVKVVLDPQSQPGTLKPVVLDGTGFKLEADSVILAVGQEPDLAGWENELALDGSTLVTGLNGSTSRPGVFAGGDVASSERYVTVAIGQGLRAGDSIEGYINRLNQATNEGSGKDVTFAEINTFYFPIIARQEKGVIGPKERLRGFSEVGIGLTLQQAMAQAGRCFSCGVCLQCDNCFYFCPDMAVVKDDLLAQHYRVLDQYCKGCGTCVEECPRGAVVLQEERR